MIIEEEVKNRIEQILSKTEKNMGDALGLVYEKVTREEVTARMPVNENTVQPFGILHGGASVALAETLASIGAWLNLTDDSKSTVGLEINANHIRPVQKGQSVTGTSKPLHRGSQTQIWETRIVTKDGKLVCVSRCTIAVINKRS